MHLNYVTRIAPSPTGMFHLGTARTAYFNWLAARASWGKFILRIDDTDIERNSDKAVQVILDSMDWLGLDFDEIYYQSERVNYYRSMAALLVDRGLARKLDNGAIILNIDDLPPTFNDTITGDIPITERDREVMSEHLILVRGDDKDRMPTYQFSSVLDDFAMGVNWIIRGHDHITNTPKQIAIWNAMASLTSLSHPLPRFSHVGLIHKDGKKLSKRDDAASLLSYRDRGYHPETILSFLMRLGWGPRNEDKTHKVIERQRALELFLDGGAMRASPAGFDQARLDLIQANYERMLKIPRDEWVRNRVVPSG